MKDSAPAVIVDLGVPDQSYLVLWSCGHWEWCGEPYDSEYRLWGSPQPCSECFFDGSSLRKRAP